MTDGLYSTPMAGTLPIFWSMTEDQEGTPEGYVGTPLSTDDIEEPIRSCVGSDIGFASDLRAIDDVSMANSIEKACSHALAKYILPRVTAFMYNAAIELRERDGGFSQEIHDARVAELKELARIRDEEQQTYEDEG